MNGGRWVNPLAALGACEAEISVGFFLILYRQVAFTRAGCWNLVEPRSQHVLSPRRDLYERFCVVLGLCFSR